MSTDDDAPAWESTKQTAKELNCSRGKVYDLIARGLLDARKLDARTIVSVESRRALIANLPKLKSKVRP
jgi:hypothetical protein